MKFAVFTNPGQSNNFLEELLETGLRPEFIATDSPFYLKRSTGIKRILGFFKVRLKYILKRSQIRAYYKPYFTAKRAGIRIVNSNKVNSLETAKLIKEKKLDYIFVFTFRILKDHILEAPKSGCINFHPSYLPYNRGATPVSWVIKQNRPFTGITFHFIDSGIDTGKIIEQHKVKLGGFENARIVYDYLLSLGSALFVRLIHKALYNQSLPEIINEANTGSYEKPFRSVDREIKPGMATGELSSIVLASKGVKNYSFIRLDDITYEIINLLPMHESTGSTSNYPSLDEFGNIRYLAKDNKLIILITKPQSVS